MMLHCSDVLSERRPTQHLDDASLFFLAVILRCGSSSHGKQTFQSRRFDLGRSVKAQAASPGYRKGVASARFEPAAQSVVSVTLLPLGHRTASGEEVRIG